MSMADISKESDPVWNSKVNHMGLIGFKSVHGQLSLSAVFFNYRCC